MFFYKSLIIYCIIILHNIIVFNVSFTFSKNNNLKNVKLKLLNNILSKKMSIDKCISFF